MSDYHMTDLEEDAYQHAICYKTAVRKHNEHLFCWMAYNYLQYSGFVATEEMEEQWWMHENWDDAVWKKYTNLMEAKDEGYAEEYDGT